MYTIFFHVPTHKSLQKKIVFNETKIKMKISSPTAFLPDEISNVVDPATSLPGLPVGW